MLLRIGVFFMSGMSAYIALAIIFGLVCLGLGHHRTEMIYGGMALYLLTLVAAVEASWLLTDDIRKSQAACRVRDWWNSRGRGARHPERAQASTSIGL